MDFPLIQIALKAGQMPLIVVLIVSLLVLGDSIVVVLSSIRSMYRLRRDRASWQANRGVGGKGSTDCRFIVLVPCFEEVTILDDVYRRFRDQFGNSANCRVVFVTSLREVPGSRRQALQSAWQADEDMELDCAARRSTPEALHSLFIEQARQENLPGNFGHVVDLSCREGKWSQLLRPSSS